MYDTLNFNINDDITLYLIFLGCISFFFMTVSILFRSYTQWKVNDFIEMMRYSLSKRLLSHIISKHYEYFFTVDNSNLAKTILSETDVLVQNVVKSVFNMFAYSIVLLFLVLLLTLYNPIVALSSFFVLLGLYLLMFKVLGRYIKASGNSISEANTERFKSINEIFTNIKYIKMTGQEHNFEREFSKSSYQYAKSQSIYQTIVQVPSHFVELIALGSLIVLCIVLIISTGGYNSEVLGIIVPTLGVYAFAAYRIKPAVHNIYAGLSSLKFGQQILLTIQNRLKDKSYNDKKGELLLDNQLQIDKGDLILENVCYRYPGSKNYTLENISLTLTSGSIVGIKGVTGSGKSTLLDLLTGLIPPTQGKLFFSDKEITHQNARNLRNKISYVPQEVLLLNASITQNIAFDEDLEKISQIKVIKAAQLAQLHDFVSENLHDGYDTIVGERGFKLSGGERQRIAIARAFYNDSQILVLDEMTSALDLVTEKKLVEGLLKECVGKTIIMVAHRMETLKHCDKLLNVENGRIHEMKNIVSDDTKL